MSTRKVFKKVAAKTPRSTSAPPRRPPPKARGKSTGRSERVHRDAELDPDAVAFPPHLWKSTVDSASRSEARTCTLELGSDLSITTDGSGLLATVISATPTNASNWSNFVNVFDEYRVLAVRVEFKPLLIAGGSTSTYMAPIIHVIDRDSSVALTSYTLANRYTSARETPGGKPFSQTIYMSSVEEAGFVSVSTTKTLGWFQFYSSGNTASFTLGRCKLTYIVQFRGLGIS